MGQFKQALDDFADVQDVEQDESAVATAPIPSPNFKALASEFDDGSDADEVEQKQPLTATQGAKDLGANFMAGMAGIVPTLAGSMEAAGEDTMRVMQGKDTGLSGALGQLKIAAFPSAVAVAPIQKYVGGKLREWTQPSQQWWQDQISDQSKNTDSFWWQVSQSVAQSTPQMVADAMFTRGTSRILKLKAGSKFAQSALSSMMEGNTAGSQARLQLQEKIAKMTPQELEQLYGGRETIAKYNGDIEKARAELSSSLGQGIYKYTMATTALSSLFVDKTIGKTLDWWLLNPKYTKMAMRGVLRLAGAEASEEALQSGLEQLVQNGTTGKPLMEGVWEAMKLGAAAGGIMGGLVPAAVGTVAGRTQKAEEAKAPQPPPVPAAVPPPVPVAAAEQAPGEQQAAPQLLPKMKEGATDRLGFVQRPNEESEGMTEREVPDEYKGPEDLPPAEVSAPTFTDPNDPAVLKHVVETADLPEGIARYMSPEDLMALANDPDLLQQVSVEWLNRKNQGGPTSPKRLAELIDVMMNQKYGPAAEPAQEPTAEPVQRREPKPSWQGAPPVSKVPRPQPTVPQEGVQPPRPMLGSEPAQAPVMVNVTVKGFKEPVQRDVSTFRLEKADTVRDKQGNIKGNRYRITDGKETLYVTDDRAAALPKAPGFRSTIIEQARSVLSPEAGPAETATPPEGATPSVAPAQASAGVASQAEPVMTGHKSRQGVGKARFEAEAQVEAIKRNARALDIDLKGIRKDAISKGNKNTDVDNALANVLAEPRYIIDGKEYTRSDLRAMDDDALNKLADKGKAGLNRTGYGTVTDPFAGKKPFDKVMLVATPLEMTPEQFAKKFDMPESKALLENALAWAKAMSEKLADIYESIGQFEKATNIRENPRYTKQLYERNLQGGRFTPSDEVIKEAVQEQMRRDKERLEGINKKIELTQKLMPGTNIRAYLERPQDFSLLKGLNDKQKEQVRELVELHNWANERGLVNGFEGSSVSLQNRSDDKLRESAQLFINDVLKPNKPSGEAVDTGSKGYTIKSRDLDRMFRVLFKPVSNPLQNFQISREEQGKHIAHHMLMRNLWEMTGLVSDSRSDENGRTVRLAGKGYGDLTASDYEKYGPLAGKWVHPTVASALGQAISPSSVLWYQRLTPILQKLDKVAEATGISKVVRAQRIIAINRPGSWMKEGASNVIGFMGMAGDLDAVGLHHLRIAVDHAMHLRFGTEAQRKAANEYFAKYSEAGIVGTGLTSMIDELRSSREPKYMIGKKAGELIDDLVAARSILLDQTAKIAGYESYMARMRKFKKGQWDEVMLKQMGKQHIFDVYDNRATIPEALRIFGKLPITDFLGFKYSSARALLNAMRAIGQEARDPDMPMAEKARRVAWSIPAMSAPAVLAGVGLGARAGTAVIAYTVAKAIAKALSKAEGTDLDKEMEPVDEAAEQHFRYFDEPYNAVAPVSSIVDGKGNRIKVVYGNSFINPHPAIDFLAGLLDTWQDKSGALTTKEKFDITKEAVDPLRNSSMFARLVSQGWDAAVDVNDAWVYKNLVEGTPGISEAAKATATEARNQAVIDAGIEALNNIAGWYGRVATEKGIQERRKQRKILQGKRMDKAGDLHDKSDTPMEDMVSSTTTRRQIVSGMLPLSAMSYSKERNLELIFDKAVRLRRKIGDKPYDVSLMEKQEGVAQDEKQGNREKLIAAHMEPWTRHAKGALEALGIGTGSGVITDILLNAGFSKAEAEYIAGL